MAPPIARPSAPISEPGSTRCAPHRRATAVIALSIALLLVGVPPAASAGELPPFAGAVERLDAATRDLVVGSSWRPGCPVPLERMRLVTVTYVGFDGAAHRGRLIVHRRWGEDVLDVFRRIYSREFPIRRVRLVDRYGADDRASMRADNTSAFNCRYVAGTTTWSRHAFGAAIDVNPVENPYVSGSHVSPRRGVPYADRSDVRPGMIVLRDVVWRAFRSIGWEWGGTWSSAQDYQHFSSDGN